MHVVPAPKRSPEDLARGKRVREAYLRAGFTRASFANALGTMYPDVDRLERGQRPEPEKLTRIAELCGVTERWLVRGPEYSQEFRQWLETQAPHDLHEIERELLAAIYFPRELHPGAEWYTAALSAWRIGTRGALRERSRVQRRAVGA